MASSLDAESSKYRGSYSWLVDGATLSSMKSAANEEEFVSDWFGIASMDWRLSANPNGWKDDNVGSFSLFLTTGASMEGEEAIVFFKMKCKELDSGYAQISSFKKNGCWGWSPFCLSFDELANCGLNAITFVVEVCVLRVIDISTKKEEILYQHQLTSKQIPNRFEFEWNIDSKTTQKMKNAYNGKYFVSSILNEMWMVQVAPNGNKRDRKDHFDVMLKLTSIPSSVSRLNVRFQIECRDRSQSRSQSVLASSARTKCFSVDIKHGQQIKDGHLWTAKKKKLFSFEAFSKMHHLDALQIAVKIHVIDLFDNDGRKIEQITQSNVCVFCTYKVYDECYDDRTHIKVVHVGADCKSLTF